MTPESAWDYTRHDLMINPLRISESQVGQTSQVISKSASHAIASPIAQQLS